MLTHVRLFYFEVTIMTVKNLRQEGAGFMGEDLDQHPSYGLISIGMRNGQKELFGSGITHNTWISLKISKAERSRTGYSDHYSEKGRIIEVDMSAAQFTGLLASMNTMGVPCSLNFIKGEGYIESPPEHNVKKEMLDDIKEQFSSLSKRVTELKNNIDDLLKGPIRKAEKDQIKKAVFKLEQDINSNIPYLSQCQLEKVEEFTAQAQAEVEATLNGLVKSAGLQALQGKLHTPLLEDSEE